MTGVLTWVEYMPIKGGEDRLTVAEMFIKAAREEIKEYRRSRNEIHYRQACEKGWGAIAQALMHLSNRSVYHHREFSEIANSLKASGKIDAVDALIAGDQLHGGGFYHGALTVSAIENAIDLIEKVIEDVKKQSRSE